MSEIKNMHSLMSIVRESYHGPDLKVMSNLALKGILY